jgi:hypothetical protein
MKRALVPSFGYPARVARTAPLLLLAAVACKSSAPYTIPAAAVNAALAVGVSAQQRAAGGCYATCTNGTICNEHTGYCEPAPCVGNCGNEVCEATPSGTVRCAPAGQSVLTSKRPPAAEKPGEVVPGVGVSPATGRAPSPPASRPASETP